jgi:FolB domain-containing protein
MNFIKSSIVLHQLELYIHLGWPESERLQKQAVMVDIHIHFPEPPKACMTDELDERTNYDSLSKKIIEHTMPKSFRLIEHLGFEIYQITKTFVPEKTLINICVTKHPPILHLKGGVQFWYGDNLS